MSMRTNFGCINGERFERTTTERGGTRHFIDGRPVKRDVWQQRMAKARADEAANARAVFAEQGIALSTED